MNFPSYMGKVEQHQIEAHSSLLFRVGRSTREEQEEQDASTEIPHGILLLLNCRRQC